jgi:nicotinamide mononucleotide transporter
MKILGQPFTPLEMAAAGITLLAIWLTVKESKWCFPLGIISCILYAFLFYDPGIRLYADTFLQVFFIVLLVYGWIHWGDKKTELPVTKLNARQWLIILSGIAAGTAGIGYFLKNYTPAAMPYADACSASMSIAAQWMVARKKIDNWPVWIVTNILYVYMYVYKDLYLTAVIYFLLLILAVAGWKKWRMHLVINQQHAQGPDT